MLITRRHAIASLVSLAALRSRSAAEEGSVHLGENPKVGDTFLCDLQLTVSGKLKVERDGKPDTIPLEAKAKHQLLERVEAVTDGGIQKAVRHYREAGSDRVTGVDRGKQLLADDRRGIVVQRTATGPVHYSPAGPLTRDDLELVSEHFETLAIPGLLPNKPVKVGESWAVSNDTAQAVCLFDGLVKNDLVGKFTGVKDGNALFTIEGKAEGIEQGAKVKLTVAAQGTFDTAKHVVVAIRWEQTDERDQGPVSPALEAKATIVLTRTAQAVDSKELAEVHAKLPADGKVPEVLTQLRHADAAYEMLYPRDWYIVVKNDKHLVLRLLNRGEFLAQATIATWKPSAANADAKAALTEFVDATKKQPGWEPEKVLENGLLQAEMGRQLYRLSASGKQDGLDVVQSFYLLTGPAGQHVAVANVCGSANLTKVGTQDVALVTAIDFPAKK
ncbi:hypothetical protein [Limnoglobus roseus]|uniref:Uncharacterized protein n=1 Tax=Limnoglobus roseus TaxID=2598579 RepID=A0A5C1AIL8_9BACT|nr:hypothetical protein [Limnoglobus roseus]QEL17997.1 hypothetical protein PX52LOC_05011 [Limnoglobus roseus]